MRLILPDSRSRGGVTPPLRFFTPDHQHLILNLKYPEKDLHKRQQNVYQQWGFEKFGTHTFMLGDDPQTDWLMKKQL